MANPSYFTFSTATASTLSPVFAVNNNIAPISVTVSVVLSSVNASTAYSVQITYDDLQGSFGAALSSATRWYDSASASSLNVSTAVVITNPIMGVRVVSAIPTAAGGTAAVSFIQAGIIN